MKKFGIVLVLIFTLTLAVKSQKVSLSSPDGKLILSIHNNGQVSYTVFCDGKVILEDCRLGLRLKDETLGENAVMTGKKQKHISEVIEPVVPLKFSTVQNDCNELTLNFKGNYAIVFRVYNDGFAYRFVTRRKGMLEVVDENFSMHFPSSYLLHLQQPGGFKTAYEESYTHINSRDWKETDRMSTLPILIDTKDRIKILVCETDLKDYPGLFLKGNDRNGVHAVFPKVPLVFGEDGDRSQKILEEAAYIAKTSGNRSFPWRYFVISREDKELAENTMSLKLSGPCELENVSWIKPGQVSWEWWNDASPYGPDVNFESGYNLETYKYYIDFASKYGIPYIIMDEGWAAGTCDPYTPNPKVDLHELLRYGQQKNVGIILWLTWLTVENHMDLFKTFAEWGVKGVKIDFMDRSDQWMVNFYEKVAKEAAKHHILVDFHGAFKPAGLEYRYPNVLSYEGVRGMEQMGGATPDNSVYFPFMRNAVGAMDYTPGAMLSMQPEVYISRRPNSAGIGTRAYQMALFVIFESGLQMLADNPTLYYRNAECTEFITDVPVTWDETRVLEAKAGEYIIVAKRKGAKWYLGGMTNNAEKLRKFEIPLDFLDWAKTYRMISFEDGVNAGRQAMDYRKREAKVSASDRIPVQMVRNGGWAAVIF